MADSPPGSSRISGFYKYSPEERRSLAAERAGLPPDALEALDPGALDLATADHMVENVVGLLALPVGLAVNLRIDGRDRIVPMALEEPSVVAAVSNVARFMRGGDGIRTRVDPSVMCGQVEIPDVPDPETCLQALEAGRARMAAAAEGLLPELERLGGGWRGVTFHHRVYDEPGEPVSHIVVVQFALDCVDAMGANMVNTVAESLALEVEAITGLETGLRILSNLADRRLARAEVQIPPEQLQAESWSGREVARRVAAASRFAVADPYRAATHNKGIMNGIDAVAVATGNDWRALEAGAHAYAARSGRYRPLSRWRVAGDGGLHGEIELPLAVGVVGGATRIHPAVRANLRLLGVERASELAGIMAGVGLAQNLAALKALATSGIQRGHMRLHARNVALTVGAREAEVGELVSRLVRDRDFSLGRAKRILAEIRSQADDEG